jgi:L-amino acid N-acyltransferase YncA
MKPNFSPVQEAHLPALAEILNYYILNTTVTFHDELLSGDDMREKVFFPMSYHRAFTIFDRHSIIGYCAVTQWKKQQAYRHAGEVNIYLAPECTGKGIGSHALNHLEKFAKANQINTLIAALCAENEPSLKLFEKNGYIRCAHFRNMGLKFGRILDTIYLQKFLNL